MRMIDADDMISFPYSEGAGTEEQIMDWIEECGLSDEEDKAKMLCWKVIEGFRNVVKTAPTIPAPQWISVEDKWPQNGQWVVAYLYDGNIVCGVYYDAVGFTLDYCYEGQGEVSHWMPTPEPPEKRYKCRYADDNGVCSKLSGNGEIIYCVEGPCPYDFPEEVRDE